MNFYKVLAMNCSEKVEKLISALKEYCINFIFFYFFLKIYDENLILIHLLQL